MIPDKVTQRIDHANAVFARLDERDGSVRDAARRERARLNAGLGRTATKVGLAVGVISLATIGVGLITPIGMFGFLAAVGLAIGVAALLLFTGGREIAAPNVAPDLPNGQMVQRFDSYLFRARRGLPAPAQAELDRLSAQLPALRQTLERVPDLDPQAQDARRLMSVHLPNLIDRYLHVPNDFRGQQDGEGATVDQRLVEALAAGRTALADIGQALARNDLAAFETQGRFIQTRYNEKTLD
ncbi:hypothetical protein [Sphingomonas xanthus]|uniref:Uncharacterized protein n=1 Tax=Sphingomonas xanthus TaxID=2594473 RepID=A0A516IPS5_9SPHN|nr:hypothetical protein [Sphingomonas xanthus]QDP18887.1 hypothetical protein FMM02_02260 [Sphingomonas xanthus]